MNRPFGPIPWLLIVLDGLGALLLVAGILGLVGVDFGYPVLRTVAPAFLVIGALLMAPLVVWVIRKARRGPPPD
ncbi:MAG: hypothetical protein GTN86_00220 [Xanthomonadales bacterium]|nr:hypothetical protein [Xanthomonadales bacterium]NIN58255.1 hypothetical protein [Xanthomonadales bacterium]NIN73607.1 hypothetical protein [Xanthomonadales bacterium]NIO14389.1 hypothetical protein [Xanthomonadales bacterium]NIP10648.1 hypothetical protein [Xanthomonadales bacterium]